MQGLELSRAFYNEVAADAIQRALPEFADRLAIGLVGEGSECFGFDDEYSQDHDWGAGICVWAPEAIAADVDSAIEPVFARFPSMFKGYPVRMAPSLRNGRVGFFSIESFYRRFINSTAPLSTWQQWYTVPEHFLAVATNGEVFSDPAGEFTKFRTALLDFYPQDVWKKKIATRLGVMAQSGQYNFLRMLKRNDTAAALLAQSRFVESAIGVMYLLNRTYMPFYKWAFRGLQNLPDTNGLVEKLTAVMALDVTRGAACIPQAEQAVENVCVEVVTLMHELGLSTSAEAWLMVQAEMLQGQIDNPQIRQLPVLHGIQYS